MTETAAPTPKTGEVRGTASPGDLVACSRVGNAYYVMAVRQTQAGPVYTIADTETGRSAHSALTDPAWRFVV